MNIDVFISHHTNSSRHIVEAISNKLESLGIRCWHSCRDIAGGDYASSIMQALESCKIFLLVLNRPASESAHVLNELEIATGRLSRQENVSIVPFHVADEDIAPAARYYIQRHHWIDAVSPPMYQRIDELSVHLVKLLGKELPMPANGGASPAARTYRLISKPPQPRDIFRGRDGLIDQIQQSFSSGKRALFLEGIGGIGKSELAKQYALRHQSEYDNVVFLTYTTNLRQLVCDPTALIIEGLEREPEEQDSAFFLRKLQILNTITDERTLLIVDNFDVNDDPDLKAFLQGKHRALFTTRNAHPGYTTIRIGAIDNTDVLMGIFEENYGCGVPEDERAVLEQIFRLVESHTYTIELIAKQMEASFLSAQEMLDLLHGGRFNDGMSETVSGRTHQRTAFEHICSLFNTGNLSPEEKQILMYLSLTGTKGILAPRFKEWARLPNFETVNQLVRKSWIRKESGQRLSLHPMVKEVVHHELAPTIENCFSFVKGMADFCGLSWFRVYGENLAVADNVVSLLEYFRELRGRDYIIFNCFCNFLWQVARFDASVHHVHRVYDACVRDFGIASMETGYTAKSVGGCYLNSGRIEESIPWYKQGLESMIASGAEESEDLGMAYEKVARCYTWKYEQDLAKAEELFRISLDIRLRLIERLKKGEAPVKLEQYVPYTVETAYSCLARVYLEMGRMYRTMGDYQKGSEFAMREALLMEQHEPENVSDIAYGYFDCGICQYHLALQLREAGDEAGAAARLADAAQNLEKALETNLKMRGALAIDTIDNQEYLADVYAAQHRFGEASNGYMAVLTMVESLLGRDHPRTETVKKKMAF